MSDTTETPKKQGPDWERIEIDYRAGLLSLREIAARDGNVTEAAIRKRAKKHGWERDLGARIQARADALLVRGLAVRAREPEIVEVNAQVIAQVRAEHRSNIGRGRALVTTLLSELEAESGDPALFAQLGEMLRAPDERGTDRLNDVYLKIISLPSRIEGVRKLTEALKNLIALEREAWDIRPAADPSGPGAPGAGGAAGVLMIDDDRLIAIATGSRG